MVSWVWPHADAIDGEEREQVEESHVRDDEQARLKVGCCYGVCNPNDDRVRHDDNGRFLTGEAETRLRQGAEFASGYKHDNVGEPEAGLMCRVIAIAVIGEAPMKWVAKPERST